MATRNIEINYLNNDSPQEYDILYPQTTPEMVINLLNNDTKEYIGLEANATPDDAFRSLYLLNVLSDKASFKLTVKDSSGSPLPNLDVKSESFVDSNGNQVTGPLKTSDKGVINTFFKEGNISISIDDYGDLIEWSNSYEIKNGNQYEYEINLSRRNFINILNSRSIAFTDNVSSIDITCVGGGGSGGGPASSVASGGGTNAQGAGGGGGYVSTQDSVSFSPYTSYSAVVGAGGASRSSGEDGLQGGTSSLLSVSAKGGQGGGRGYSSRSSYAKGGIGNGNGASVPEGYIEDDVPGGNGTQSGYDSYSTTRVYGGGGGYGGYGGGDDSQGGNPAGGYGANYDRNAAPGTNGLGGGGGGGHRNSRERVSGKGGNGCINIRMHLIKS